MAAMPIEVRGLRAIAQRTSCLLLYNELLVAGGIVNYVEFRNYSRMAATALGIDELDDAVRELSS